MCSAIATPDLKTATATPPSSPSRTEADASHDAALGFNLLTSSLGLRSYHRLWHGNSPLPALDGLLRAYLAPGGYVTSTAEETAFDLALLHCDSPAGQEHVTRCLSADGQLPIGTPLVAVWATMDRLEAVRGEWLNAALARGRSAELLVLGGLQWAIFRSRDHRLLSPVSLGLAGALNESPSPASQSADAGPQAAAPPGEDTAERHLERLDQEIARYRDCIDVHDLPQIYHFWSHRYVRPKLLACGFNDVDDFFLQNLLSVARQDPQTRHRVASIGAGNCDLEVRLAVLARAEGVENLLFHCLELNPYMIDRGRELARQEGVEDFFEFEVIDIDLWEPQGPHGACIANHSLHHIVELELLFEKIRRAIGDHGVFLTNDMIGRNGHMRWPEALVHVEEIWSTMPRRYKYNHQLQRMEDDFDNWDCSKEGNEGIRAEDILPLLLKSFHFESFMAFANIIDIFVDRSFGHNFDADSQGDLDFIERIAELDEAKLNSGEVKPTHLIAAMRTTPVEQPKYYEHWTPEFCVRYPNGDDA